MEMSQQPPEERSPEGEGPEEEILSGTPGDTLDVSESQLVEEEPEEEYLSGTLLGGLQQVTRGLGALGTVLFGGALLAILLGGITWLVSSDLRIHGSILLAIGAGLLLVSLAISLPAVRVTVGARRGRYGINTFAMVFAFLGIAAIGNFLAFEYTSRFDVTATNQFSLSKRTQELLSNLDDPIKAWAFFNEENPAQQGVIEVIENMLREMDARSGKFSYEIVDPDRNPDVALEKGYQPPQPIVFENKESGRLHGVAPSLFVSASGLRTSFLEQDFVTATLIVTGVERKTVCFLTLHNERDINDGESPDGYGVAASIGLSGENYEPRTLNLLNPDLPATRLEALLVGRGDECVQEDLAKPATVVVIAGPKQDLFQGELDILDGYLRDGGLMLVLADIDTPDLLRQFLLRWGIEVEQGFIWDEDRFMAEFGPRTPVAVQEQYEFVLPEAFGLPDPFGLEVDKITASLGITFYPGVASLSPAEGVAFFPDSTLLASVFPNFELLQEGEDELPESPNILANALAITSPDSWLIDDPSRTEPDKAVDRRGPFFPAVALRAIAPVGEELPDDPSQINVASIVVIGDADFASNQNFYDPRATNSDFFLNAVNWLAGDVALHGIRPKPITSREVVLDKNQERWAKISPFLLAAAVGLLGVVAWWRRR